MSVFLNSLVIVLVSFPIYVNVVRVFFCVVLGVLFCSSVYIYIIYMM
jgi:hypothetical protein